MSMRTSGRIWRESASLILAAKSVFTQSNPFNYKILCLKRSAKSKFMPETYVFPGGAISKSDSSTDWWKLYEKFGFQKDTFGELRPIENVPEILQNDKEEELPKYLSFRICAIRETFEECGILLCKTPRIDHDMDSKWASFIGGPDFINWQHRVLDDSSEFLNLCKHFDVYPDVWGLKIWSNWLTPPSFSLRFNAVNFLASLNQAAPVNKDNKEIQDLMWMTPEQCIQYNNEKSVLLPPPQTYEISRLRNICDIEKLAEFAEERSKYGCEPYWPHRIETNEGTYSVLPGDDLYPARFDPNNIEVAQMDKIPDSHTKNRIFHKTEYLNMIKVQNFKPKCNQLTPYIE